MKVLLTSAPAQRETGCARCSQKRSVKAKSPGAGRVLYARERSQNFNGGEVKRVLTEMETLGGRELSSGRARHYRGQLRRVAQIEHEPLRTVETRRLHQMRISAKRPCAMWSS